MVRIRRFLKQGDQFRKRALLRTAQTARYLYYWPGVGVRRRAGLLIKDYLEQKGNLRKFFNNLQKFIHAGKREGE